MTRALDRRIASLETTRRKRQMSYLVTVDDPSDRAAFDVALARHVVNGGTQPVIIVPPVAPDAATWLQKWSPAWIGRD